MIKYQNKEKKNTLSDLQGPKPVQYFGTENITLHHIAADNNQVLLSYRRDVTSLSQIRNISHFHSHALSVRLSVVVADTTNHMYLPTRNTLLFCVYQYLRVVACSYFRFEITNRNK